MGFDELQEKNVTSHCRNLVAQKSSPFQGLGLFSSMYFLRRQNPNCLRAVLTSSSLSVLIKDIASSESHLNIITHFFWNLCVYQVSHTLSLLLLQICSMTIWMLLVLLVDLSITVKTVLKLRYVCVNLYANHFCVIQFYSEIIILGIAQKYQLWQHSSKLSLTSRAQALSIVRLQILSFHVCPNAHFHQAGLRELRDTPDGTTPAFIIERLRQNRSPSPSLSYVKGTDSVIF